MKIKIYLTYLSRHKTKNKYLNITYPLVLTSTNDTIQVGNVGAGVFNVLVTGDKEI